MKNMLIKKIKSSMKYLTTFIKWCLISIFVGIIGGLVGTGFHKSVDYVTELRSVNSWFIFLLPLGGLLIVAIYKLCKVNEGTNRVIESVRTEKNVPVLMAPLIFVSTVITHLLGGSAGREGAALQLGGSIGYQVGKFLKLDTKDMHLIVMLGMSSVFAALFGTPLTATFFALEVISVGIIYYVALVPCVFSAIVACGIAKFFAVAPVHFQNITVVQPTIIVIIKVIILSILCAFVSICFCSLIKFFSKLAEEKIPNSYLRAFVGGCIIIILTLAVGTYDYNGAGMNVITRALSGDARPMDFLFKIVFTVITISAGFKGGEIIPTFFIGSTFGCVVGGLLGLNPAYGAAIGFVALFCGVANCPIASILLALEVFGAESIVVFAIVCGVSYMMSGYYGLYSSQKIMYSKLEAKYININTK